ncbi:Tetratricopeptide repeat protein 25 [Clydaea vesicula]|uniref:Outer dynein arm-docking complex subunit 4 n=1 Tax=Clydaea vesicula TaxID=447962 RepID=A0AAD5XWY7_9FUNG|nr:Tetratricopeptide repeat protein 25 [Clydaea vesicula]KAJ3392642.1 Tetratricopeptide repeat protein 25 [Lobulomyces angularis]
MADASDGEVILSPEEIMATFVSLAAEGDLYGQRGFFVEAIESYTRALSLRPEDKNCLVSRSRCHLQVGDADLSLLDAEESLKEDPSYFKGQFQKAEALYAMGDFEMALMFYHRGNKLRPELEEFRIGIQKCREAIENSIGDPKTCKISISPKLKKEVLQLFSNPLRKEKGKANDKSSKIGGYLASTPTNVVPQTPVVSTVNPNNPNSVNAFLIHRGITPPATSTLTPAMESKLLGDLYDDKAYLSKLLSDRDLIEHPNDHVLRLVAEGLNYFNTRIDFWRQQNPLYARQTHQLKYYKPLKTKHHEDDVLINKKKIKRVVDEHNKKNRVHLPPIDQKKVAT